MIRKLLLLAFLVVLGLPAASAQPQAPAAETPLQLVPYPQEVHRGSGGFTVGPTTRILIEARHAAEDRTAAETLAEEIAARTGRKIPIRAISSAAPVRGAIVLGRLASRTLRTALARQELLPGAEFHDQGYLLSVAPSGVIVAGQSGQGLFYGVQTLRQLLRTEGKRLRSPAVQIRDWPAMTWRGMQDDISRGPIPTMDYMKNQIRTLAAFKMNLFALYMEHSFAYEQNPIFAPPGALTPAEARELVAYARKYYVTILPEQQTFGHLHNVLKYEMYSDLAETPHGHVLAPSQEGSYRLVESMYKELSSIFPAPFFHIGSDETFELGRGQSKALAEEKGLGDVYLNHLRRVSEDLKPEGKKLIFWGDVAMKYPELLGILPKDEMIAMPWAYDPRPSFEAMLKPFKDAGFQIIVAPGANNWHHMWPNLEAAFVNARNFVRDGQAAGALGMLNTTWLDDGEGLMDMAWPALVFGGAAAWQKGESPLDRFKDSYDWSFYRNDDSTFRDAIENLDHCHTLMDSAGLREAADSYFWADPFSENGAQIYAKVLPVAHELRLSAERALVSLLRNRARAHAHPETLGAMIFAARRLDAFGMEVELTAELNRFYWETFRNQSDKETRRFNLREMTGTNGRLEDLKDSAVELRAQYEKLWMEEYRPDWIGNVLVRYDRMAGRYEAKIAEVHQAFDRFQTSGALPQPESLGFYLKP